MSDRRPIDPEWAWQAYRPSDEAPWNLQRVGHLYRRAAFGATLEELEAGLEAGPDRAVTLLLDGRADADEEAVWTTLRDVTARTNNSQQLPAVWLYRMLHTRRPLVEKMTLLWHDHFATSNAKVNDAGYMLRQNETLRRHALGSFADMLRELTVDPAMLIWLDTVQSTRQQPNENYARELMELFSLGIDHPAGGNRRNYTEADIRQAARAFTGWRVQRREAVFDARQHDSGPKDVFGRRGNWRGEDIVRLCLEHESCPHFIAKKLFVHLVSETLPPTRELLQPLATQLRREEYRLRPVVERILRSNLFFSAQAYRTKIKSPVEFALGIVRGLEAPRTDRSDPRRFGTLELAAALEGLGQKVFYPPSVAGWDGGPAWLNGQTMLLRHNLALALTSTTDDRFGGRTDPVVLAQRSDARDDPARIDLLLRVFLQGDHSAEVRQRLVEYLQQARTRRTPVFWTQADAEAQRIRSLCHVVLCLPEYQLC